MKRIEVNVITDEVTEIDLTPEEIAALPPPPPPPPLPAITRRQLRLALLRLGLTGAQVEAEIAGMPGTPAEREAVMIEWQDNDKFNRHHPLVVAIGAALGMNETQIDAAWKVAVTL